MQQTVLWKVFRSTLPCCGVIHTVDSNLCLLVGRFLQGLREACDAIEVPLIFDEIAAGFRIAPGGAQELYGVTPDLCCLGKIIAGGKQDRFRC